MIRAKHVFETVLYAADLEKCERFYGDAMGLEVLARNELMLVLRCGDSVLLIFDPGRSERLGRDVPSHGSRGPGHVAFGMRESELPEWRARLREAGVEIEQEVEWEAGGVSLYVRDPAGNSVELAPPTLWEGPWKWVER